MGRIGGSAYLPRGVSLRKGRARHRPILTASSSGGLAAPDPATHPMGSLSPARRCKPKLGPREVATTGAGGFPGAGKAQARRVLQDGS